MLYKLKAGLTELVQSAWQKGADALCRKPKEESVHRSYLGELRIGLEVQVPVQPSALHP